MSSELLSALTSLVTPDLVSKFASASGESTGNVSKALGAALPALLSGFAGKADDSAAFGNLFNMITSPANDASVLSNPASWLGDVAGGKSTGVAGLAASALSGLFGGRTDGIANAIAQYAGVKSASARSLLSMATPVALAFLGDVVKKRILNANGLATLLRGERSAIQAAVPGDLRTALGFAGPASAPAPQRDREVAAAASGDSRWWVWLIPLLLIPLLWFLLRPRPRMEGVATDTLVPSATMTVDTARGAGGAVAPGDTAMPRSGGAAGAAAAGAAAATGGATDSVAGGAAVPGDTMATVRPDPNATGAMGGQGAPGKAQ